MWVKTSQPCMHKHCDQISTNAYYIHVMIRVLLLFRLDDWRKCEANFQRASSWLYSDGERSTEIPCYKGRTIALTCFATLCFSSELILYSLLFYVLQLKGEDAGPGEIHRRESERGLLDVDLEDPDEEGLEDGLATPPLQHSPSWSLPRSRINSYRVIHTCLGFVSFTTVTE